MIDWHAGFIQRLDDADMSEAPRATAGEHQAHGAAGDEARHSAHIVGRSGAQMMVGFEQTAAQREVFGKIVAQACGMDQQQLRQAGRAFLKRGHVEWAQRQRSVGTRQQKNPIRLAQTQMRPGTVRGIAAIEDEIMIDFEIGEPFGGLISAAAIEHGGVRAHVNECCRKALHDGFSIQAVLQWYDGEGFGTRRAVVAACGVLQALHHDPHKVEHHARIACDETVEGFGADAQQFAVAQRHELGRMGFAGD